MNKVIILLALISISGYGLAGYFVIKFYIDSHNEPTNERNNDASDFGSTLVLFIWGFAGFISIASLIVCYIKYKEQKPEEKPLLG